MLLAGELRRTPELVALRARFAFAQGDPRTALALAAPIEADGDARPSRPGRGGGRDGRGVRGLRPP